MKFINVKMHKFCYVNGHFSHSNQSEIYHGCFLQYFIAVILGVNYFINKVAQLTWITNYFYAFYEYESRMEIAW